MKFVKKKSNLNFNFLKNLFITKEMFLEYEPWIYKISEGEYEWVAALEAISPNPLYDPFNPTTVYAYRARSPEGIKMYVFAYFPQGCPESACATYFSTGATDKNLGEYMESLIAKAYELEMGRIKPEEFFEVVGDLGFYEIEPSELEKYDFIRPTPSFGRKILDYLKKLRPSLEVSPFSSPRKSRR
jgi:hypothetical protein